MTTQATIDTIEQSLTSYADSSNHVTGFVTWVWDMRQETLTALQTRQDEGIAEELEHHAEQVAISDDVDAPQAAGKAAAQYIAEHRDTLIQALQESLQDD